MKRLLKYTVLLTSIFATLTAANAHSPLKTATNSRICDLSLGGEHGLEEGTARAVEAGISLIDYAPTISAGRARMTVASKGHEIWVKSPEDLVRAFGTKMSRKFLSYFKTLTDSLNAKLRANGEPEVHLVRVIFRDEVRTRIGANVLDGGLDPVGKFDMTAFIELLGDGTLAFRHNAQVQAAKGQTLVIEDFKRARRHGRDTIRFSLQSTTGPRLGLTLRFSSDSSTPNRF